MAKKKDKIARIETGNKFKLTEKNAKDSPVKDIQWEGQEVGVESDTKISEDKGTGQAVILRFFEFGVNFESFKNYKPTGQELFNSHRRGIEAMLWADGLMPFDLVQPRLMFSKDKRFYRFIIGCLPKDTLVDKPQTLSELLTTKS